MDPLTATEGKGHQPTTEIDAAPAQSQRYTDKLLSLACQHSAVINTTLQTQGQLSLGEYVYHQCRPRSHGWQPSSEVAESFYQCAAPLLGSRIAQQVYEDVLASPNVMSAQHQGVDFFAQSVQSSLMFALRDRTTLPAPGTLPQRTRAETVPVLACGNIPLDNLTYPRGLIAYRHNVSRHPDAPLRLPLFPDRLKRKIVSATPAYDLAMVERLSQRISKSADMFDDAMLTALHDTTRLYRTPEVLAQSSYSAQCTLLNNQLWKKLLPQVTTPELVYLELEQVAGKLLNADLFDPFSLFYQLVFKEQGARRLYQGLDGVKGCWQGQQLHARWLSKTGRMQPSTQQHASHNCGSFLFWGISEHGDKVPLALSSGLHGQLQLRGVDDRQQVMEVDFSPAALDRALEAGRLVPSVFSCMLILVFARGLNCLGGYYQGIYLAQIQKGLITTLQSGSYANRLIAHVQNAPVSGYLSGMQGIMTRAEHGGLIPAGPLEILAGGGLTADHLEQLGSLSVTKAHRASLLETLDDICPAAAELDNDWRLRLALDLSKDLHHHAMLV